MNNVQNTIDTLTENTKMAHSIMDMKVNYVLDYGSVETDYVYIEGYQVDNIGVLGNSLIIRMINTDYPGLDICTGYEIWFNLDTTSFKKWDYLDGSISYEIKSNDFHGSHILISLR